MRLWRNFLFFSVLISVSLLVLSGCSTGGSSKDVPLTSLSITTTISGSVLAATLEQYDVYGRTYPGDVLVTRISQKSGRCTDPDTGKRIILNEDATGQDYGVTKIVNKQGLVYEVNGQWKLSAYDSATKTQVTVLNPDTGKPDEIVWKIK